MSEGTAWVSGLRWVGGWGKGLRGVGKTEDEKWCGQWSVWSKEEQTQKARWIMNLRSRESVSERMHSEGRRQLLTFLPRQEKGRLRAHYLICLWEWSGKSSLGFHNCTLCCTRSLHLVSLKSWFTLPRLQSKVMCSRSPTGLADGGGDPPILGVMVRYSHSPQRWLGTSCAILKTVAWLTC